MTNRNQYNWDAKDWRDITPQCDIRPIQPTPLQIAEDALLECQRLLKAADDYEWLYWNTDYPQRVDKHIAEALDAVIESRNVDYYRSREDDAAIKLTRLEEAGYLNEG